MNAHRLAFLVASCLVPVLANAAVSVDTPRVEHAEAPTYVDVARPRFSWIVHADTNGTRQTGYRIVVSRRGAAVWDSVRTPVQVQPFAFTEWARGAAATAIRSRMLR